jgi:hypothetical protein
MAKRRIFPCHIRVTRLIDLNLYQPAADCRWQWMPIDETHRSTNPLLIDVVLLTVPLAVRCPHSVDLSKSSDVELHVVSAAYTVAEACRRCDLITSSRHMDCCVQSSTANEMCWCSRKNGTAPSVRTPRMSFSPKFRLLEITTRLGLCNQKYKKCLVAFQTGDPFYQLDSCCHSKCRKGSAMHLLGIYECACQDYILNIKKVAIFCMF